MTAKKEHEPIEAYIALGSNIEPRGHYIQQAMNLISDHPQIEVIEMSSVYETQPVGGPEQGPYLNAVTKIRTTLAPMELLSALQKIEKDLGRKRTVHWGPRTIDLDILLYGEEIISNDRLIVPHPLMHERRFVMQPLAQIAPDVIHPILQMSAKTILDSLGEGEEDETPGRIEG
jgi:2-amino-4-hydroxy-6-hydroxymethyldihydropteridine diphosphokinase